MHERRSQRIRRLPDPALGALWDSIILDAALKEQLLAQAVLNFTLRTKVDRPVLPLHGAILLVGPPGTSKTSLARGLAHRTAGIRRSPKNKRRTPQTHKPSCWTQGDFSDHDQRRRQHLYAFRRVCGRQHPEEHEGHRSAQRPRSDQTGRPHRQPAQSHQT